MLVLYLLSHELFSVTITLSRYALQPDLLTERTQLHSNVELDKDGNSYDLANPYVCQ